MGWMGCVMCPPPSLTIEGGVWVVGGVGCDRVQSKLTFWSSQVVVVGKLSLGAVDTP